MELLSYGLLVPRGTVELHAEVELCIEVLFCVGVFLYEEAVPCVTKDDLLLLNERLVSTDYDLLASGRTVPVYEKVVLLYERERLRF